jgi:hypothetical protein
MQMIFTTQLQTRGMGAHLWNDSAVPTSARNSDSITCLVVQCMHYKISCREERQYQIGTNKSHTSSFYELLELTPHPRDSAVMTYVSHKVLAANQVG